MLTLEVAALARGETERYRYDFDGDRAEIRFGRGEDVDVLLPDDSVWPVHARLARQSGAYHIVCEGSPQGTYCNGTRLSPGRPQALRPGDRIAIGNFLVTFGASHGSTTDRSLSLARRVVDKLADPSPSVQRAWLRLAAAALAAAAAILGLAYLWSS